MCKVSLRSGQYHRECMNGIKYSGWGEDWSRGIFWKTVRHDRQNDKQMLPGANCIVTPTSIHNRATSHTNNHLKCKRSLTHTITSTCMLQCETSCVWSVGERCRGCVRSLCRRLRDNLCMPHKGIRTGSLPTYTCNLVRCQDGPTLARRLTNFSIGNDHSGNLNP